MSELDALSWTADWLWSLPLIALCVVIHVIGLGLINEQVVDVLSGVVEPRRFMRFFAVVMGATALVTTALHGVESAIWAAAYRLLGALPDSKSAMLYSLSAMTTYGHATAVLEGQWRMMGALKSLNGVMLFGFTTAFLFAMIEKVWPLGSRGRRTGSSSRR